MFQTKEHVRRLSADICFYFFEQFNHRIIGQVASDIILLLVDHMDVLQEHFPDVPPRVVEVGILSTGPPRAAPG